MRALSEMVTETEKARRHHLEEIFTPVSGKMISMMGKEL